MFLPEYLFAFVMNHLIWRWLFISLLVIYTYVYIYIYIYTYIYIYYILYIEIDGFLILDDRTRYLVLFGGEKYDDFIYSRIRYLIWLKSGITYVISHNYEIIKSDSYDSLTVEKTLTFYIIILIKSVFNKAKNNYHYNILFETCSYK